MKFLLTRAIVAILLLGSVAVASAQEQERKLLDRLLKPDETLQNRSFERSFYFGKKFNGSGTARVSQFQFEDKVSTKSYSTKGFALKPYWSGDFKFETKKARTEDPFHIPDYSETKKVESEVAREDGKTYGSRDYPFVRDAPLLGKSQKVLDKESKSKPMTIDEVRELLNKN